MIHRLFQPGKQGVCPIERMHTAYDNLIASPSYKPWMHNWFIFSPDTDRYTAFEPDGSTCKVDGRPEEICKALEAAGKRWEAM